MTHDYYREIECVLRMVFASFNHEDITNEQGYDLLWGAMLGTM